ncbi:acyltransferase [Streptomyces sp. NPDC102279]|uniref:acyltransferase family protein n=1 Tax=Streptomyces sp. NPDC102279 TaxID=3366153 RepID=UPI0037F88428
MSWEQQPYGNEHGYRYEGHQGQGRHPQQSYAHHGQVPVAEPPGQPSVQPPVQPSVTAAEPAPDAPPKGGHRAGRRRGLPAVRDRYFDSLRAVALVRVVAYHTFGWAWAGLVFPSMGVMFGLAGTLMAKSLERPAPKVVKSRLRRLLPPFWFWGVFVVLAMLVHGWMPGRQIVYWIVPLGDPPGNAWGEQAWEILWYLRTYLWFVLLSPLLLRVFRLAPVPVLVLSLAPVLVLNFFWDAPDNRFGSALWDLATYLFCWLLGFAHRDGVLQRLRPAAVVVASLAALAYGGWFAFAHRSEFGTYDLDEIPLAQAFWSAGFVTLLLYFKAYYDVDFAWLTRFRRLDRTVTIFNARAVTIYLWHEIALILAVPLIDQFWKVPAFEKWLPLESQWFMFGIGWVLIWIAIALFGWVEDVAARKKPKLLP